MSPEMITILTSSAALLLSFFGTFIGGFAWMIKRTDAILGEQSKALTKTLAEKIDPQRKRLDSIERELVEVKVAIARLEGPPRRLVTAR